MELSVEDLVSTIFCKLPQDEKSIQLQFVENLDLKEMFEFLLTFFTEGAKLRYGNLEGKIDISSWGNKEINMMKEYFKSIGFRLNIESFNHKKNFLFDYSSHTYDYTKVKITEKTKLGELKVSFKCEEYIHIIYFDII
tara:strand:- start:1347 stop:1760 length:414 start_codon:yes stop_codon:yes gene_type:complete